VFLASLLVPHSSLHLRRWVVKMAPPSAEPTRTAAPFKRATVRFRTEAPAGLT